MRALFENTYEKSFLIDNVRDREPDQRPSCTLLLWVSDMMWLSVCREHFGLPTGLLRANGKVVARGQVVNTKLRPYIVYTNQTKTKEKPVITWVILLAICSSTLA